MTEVKTKPDEYQAAKSVLITFARYGFKKTSMQDIADAAGVSRQSVYKKFGSKEQCYQWVIRTYLIDMYSRIFAALDKDELPVAHTLLKVFEIFILESVEIVNHPHGTLILDDALKAANNSDEDWPLRFRARLADYLSRHKLTSADKAQGVAFTLIYAGKGLILEGRNNDEFYREMPLIINSITTADI